MRPELRSPLQANGVVVNLQYVTNIEFGIRKSFSAGGQVLLFMREAQKHWKKVPEPLRNAVGSFVKLVPVVGALGGE